MKKQTTQKYVKYRRVAYFDYATKGEPGKNLQGRSAIMDCVARDSEGKQFDVEIQQDNEGASPKRARYHSGLMDMNTFCM